MKWWAKMPWSSFSECWALSQFFTLLFHHTFIKKPFSSSSLSAIRVVSSTHLSLLIFLLAILIPACDSSSPVFLMMYSAYKLNKQGDNIQPWRTSFPIWNQSVSPCPVLTVTSWLRILQNLAKLANSVYVWLGNCAPESIQLLFWSYCIMIYSGKDKLMLGMLNKGNFIEENGLIGTEDYR